MGEENGSAGIRQGVRQGCPRLSLIFNIYIEFSIEQVLEISKRGVNGETIQQQADNIAAFVETFTFTSVRGTGVGNGLISFI